MSQLQGEKGKHPVTDLPEGKYPRGRNVLIAVQCEVSASTAFVASLCLLLLLHRAPMHPIYSGIRNLTRFARRISPSLMNLIPQTAGRSMGAQKYKIYIPWSALLARGIKVSSKRYCIIS